MAAAQMHDGQVGTSTDLVRRLLAAQFPRWSRLTIRPVEESGTDHALYRIGRHLVARLPIIGWAANQAESDGRWLPRLAPHLPLQVPVPVAVGRPGEGFPWPWSVVQWIGGGTPDGNNLDLAAAAADLARFVRSLHGIPADGGPVTTGTARGVPLTNLDAGIRRNIDELNVDGDVDCDVDIPAVTRAWDEAVSAPSWDGPPVWIHGDIAPGNLLVRKRRLVAVIDFGALGLGDPAPDLASAWNLFPAGATRAQFRAAVGYDDATWARARGWVLAPALQGLRYYRRTRPDLAAVARARIDAVLADPTG